MWPPFTLCPIQSSFFSLKVSFISLAFHLTWIIYVSLLNPSPVFQFVASSTASALKSFVSVCCVLADVTLLRASCLLFLSKLILCFLHSFFLLLLRFISLYHFILFLFVACQTRPIIQCDSARLPLCLASSSWTDTWAKQTWGAPPSGWERASGPQCLQCWALPSTECCSKVGDARLPVCTLLSDQQQDQTFPPALATFSDTLFLHSSLSVLMRHFCLRPWS